MAYRIGLDIGITSVGWATVILLDGQMISIGDLGVRIFDKAENPKDGASLALPRREKRSMRRRLRRHRYRMERIKQLIEKSGVLSIDEIHHMYEDNLQVPDVYKLRSEGLDRLLTSKEWARILIHIAKRRGFKSNRKSETSNKKSDEGKMLTSVLENNKLMNEKGYRSVGEMLCKDEKFSRTKRNKSEEYSHTLSRDLLVQEIEKLFEAQRQFGNAGASEAIQEEYIKIFCSQRSFDQGPGLPSPYAGNQIEKMLGECTFEKGEKRAVKASYTFERFMLLTKINNMRIRTTGTGIRKLTDDERRLLLEEAYNKTDLKYSAVRKLLSLGGNDSFSGISYGRKSEEDVEKSSLVKLTAWHDIRKALDKIHKGYIEKLSKEALDEIGWALTVYKNDIQIKEYLSSAGIENQAVEKLLDLSFRKAGHLSLKALKKIILYMESGLDYDKACTEAGYNIHGLENTKTRKLLPIDDEYITNPVVKRALSQAVKVINAIIDRYGSPDAINIELARDMSRNFRERNEITKQMEENMQRNDNARQRIVSEFGIMSPKGNDIVKLKLFEEQDGYCLYTGEKMDVRRIFDDGYADVDHIIPYSTCFNDSYNNKVLVKSAENRQKGNLLPLEYLHDKPEKMEKFLSLVSTLQLSYPKKQNLLRKSIGEQEAEEFKERNLNDTRYITRCLKEHIRNQLLFADPDRKKPVVCVNGQVTAYVRKRWGLTKVRDEGDKHHALDAVVVACIDDGIIQKVTKYHKYQETRFLNREVLSNAPHFPEPWPKFRKELEARLSDRPQELIKSLRLPFYHNDEEIKNIFVSRAPRRKNRGQGHKDTISSPRIVPEGFVIKKTSITNLKYEKGEIKDYYNADSDRLLYQALCRRLDEFDGDAEKAFAGGFYKPKANGEQGPLVKKVKVIEKSNMGVALNQGKGYAANGDMIRIDIFSKNDKYYFVPVYAADTTKKDLPNKASASGKPYEQWPEMDESAGFLFSLYPKDLIRIEHKSGVDLTFNNGNKKKVTEGFFYYRKAGIATASIAVDNHDNSASIPSMGIATLKKLEKWQVDYLGNLTKVKKEKRMGFSNKG